MISPLTTDQRRHFAEQGYVILRGFFDRAAMDAARARVDALWAACPADMPAVIDGFIGTPNERRMFFREAGPEVRQQPYKLPDLYLYDDVIRNLSADARLMAAMTDLMTAPAVVMHSLLLEYGSQQEAHFDTFYMPSATANMMAASWIALERADTGNGPLFYYPKSHLIPPFRFSTGHLRSVPAEFPKAKQHMQRIIDDYGLQRQTLLAEPGDVLIWHAQLLHGGSGIDQAGRTRLSLVTHYWTTLDIDRPGDRIDLGDGRLLLNKPPPGTGRPPQSPAVSAEQAAQYVARQATPAEDRAAAPAGFDPVGYLSKNPDVYAAGMDPYTHYNRHGRMEGRLW